ncbi:MAG: HAMP domain-containing histidine kinase [Bdellovibrionales bacterium]|nr:HAMP domain-containing histidine kinase [Bdellovibrionales bacterium]
MKELWFFITGVLISAALSGVVSLRQSEQATARYVSVWEEEIARELLLKTKSPLLHKVETQLQDIASDVEACDGAKQFQQNLAVTLYGTPAGSIRVCRAPLKTAVQAARSPVFLVGTLLSLILAMSLFMRRRREEWQSLELSRNLEMAEQFSSMARHVAHDIRAPLSALTALTQTDTDLNESRELLELTTHRINGIADGLLAKGRLAAAHETKLKRSLEQVLKEARLLSPHHRFTVGAIDDALELPVQPLDFERMLSNLINNAIEATAATPTPHIQINAVKTSNLLTLNITDNGVGVPKNLINELGRRPISAGKSNGNGLGVYGAKNFMDRARGRFRVSSNQSGTCIELEFPLTR